MLLYYKFKNFFSFGEETMVDFRLNKKAPVNRLSVELSNGQRVSKVMAIIGPNASGKTNLIKPLGFLEWFIGRSFSNSSKDIATEGHIFSDSDISEFEVGFYLDDKEYRYELKVNKKQVFWEALYVKKNSSFNFMFRREWNTKTRAYDYSQKLFGFHKAQADRTAKHVSILSAANHYGVPLANDFFWATRTIGHNLHMHGRHHFQRQDVLDATEFYGNHERYLNQMSTMLSQFDLGLSEVIIEDQEMRQGSEIVTKKMPVGVHKNDTKTVMMDLFAESSGTQSAFVLLHRLLPVLATGGLAVIDELEADLHPHMIEPILELFFNPETNPLDAQIIFTCHAVVVLNCLNKRQIMLVEKGVCGNSEAIRLDSIDGIRPGENLLAKYNAGVYGATPNV